jgi:hypothetical protein
MQSCLPAHEDWVPGARHRQERDRRPAPSAGKREGGSASRRFPRRAKREASAGGPSLRVGKPRTLDGPSALLLAGTRTMGSDHEPRSGEGGGGSCLGAREDPAARGPRERPVWGVALWGVAPLSRRCAAAQGRRGGASFGKKAAGGRGHGRSCRLEARVVRVVGHRPSPPCSRRPPGLTIAR